LALPFNQKVHHYLLYYISNKEIGALLSTSIMAAITFKKDILPHILAIAVFLIATIIFYAPIFFDGKQIHQHDILQGLGGGQEVIEYRERTGEEALWTNSMFGGMPAYLINTRWSGDLLEIPQRILSLSLPGSSKVTFLTMICFYIMLLAFKVRPYLAIAGALAFGFTSYNIIGIMAGHLWRMVAIAYIPLVIAGVHLIYSGKKLLGFALTALAFGLEIRSNHFQITYYLIIMLAIYGIITLVYAIKEKTLKPFLINSLIVVGAGLLGVAANFGKIWSVYEYSQYSMRGPSEVALNHAENPTGLARDYAFAYSNSIFEPLVLLIPNFMGGPTQQALSADSKLGEAMRRQTGMTAYQIEQQLQHVPTYWGKQPLTAPYYAGAAIFFLFVIGLFVTDRKIKYWSISIIVVGIVLSWGNNFPLLNYFLFDHFPLYDKFRSVTFTIVMAIFGIQLVGILGIQGWLDSNSKKEKKSVLLYSLAITGGFLLLIAIFAGIGSYRAPVDDMLAANVPPWFIDALRNDRASLMRSDAFRSLLFVFLSAAALWLSFKGKISLPVALGGLITIVYIDLALVSNRYLNEGSYTRNPVREYFAKTEADDVMLSEQGDFRVLNLNNPFNEARTSYYHSSIGGYHGAKIRRYQDLIERCIVTEISEAVNTLRAGNRDFSALHVLNMLNTRFIYAGDTKNLVFANDYAYGNAWLVSSAQLVDNPTEELLAVCETNTRETAVIDRSRVDIDGMAFDATGTVELTNYEPNHLVYNAKLNGNSLIIFSEVYYPEGWRVTVNGEESEHFRANFILRAMKLPAGEHTIEFRFEPRSYHVGNSVMLVFSGLILLIMIAAISYETIKFTNK
jgi:hypothetical protein